MRNSFAMFTLAMALSFCGLSFAQPPVISNPSPVCPLALNQWATRRTSGASKVEAVTNLDLTSTNGTGIFPQLSLARVTLAPCAVRVMHTHANVDELLYVISGTVSASTVLLNGTVCEQGVLKAGDAYAYPRNLVHSARNPSCKDLAVVLGFFSAVDSATINIATAAYNIPASPFKQYVSPGLRSSVEAAASPTTLAWDAECLSRCKIKAPNGQVAV